MANTSGITMANTRTSEANDGNLIARQLYTRSWENKYIRIIIALNLFVTTLIHSRSTTMAWKESVYTWKKKRQQKQLYAFSFE